MACKALMGNDNLRDREADVEYLKSEDSIGAFLGIADTLQMRWKFAISLG